MIEAAGVGRQAMPIKRIHPKLPGGTYRTQTASGRIYVTITRDGHGRPFEVLSGSASRVKRCGTLPDMYRP